MNFGRVVGGLDGGRREAGPERVQPDAPGRRVVAGPAEGHGAAEVARHGGQVAGGVGEVAAEAGQGAGQLGALEEGHAVLGHQDAARRQAAPAVLIEAFPEQHLARTDGVGRIDDDDVVSGLRAGDEVDPVGDHQLGARVLEGRAADRAQVPLGEIDHAGVDLDHGGPLDGTVLEHLLQHAAVAAADDQHLARRAVGQDRHVGHHLVIDELVALGGLDDVIEGHHPAQHRVLEYHHPLVLGLAVVENLGGFELEPEALVQGLLIPTSHPARPRRISSTAMRSGLKAARRVSIVACGSAPPHMKTSSAA